MKYFAVEVLEGERADFKLVEAKNLNEACENHEGKNMSYVFPINENLKEIIRKLIIKNSAEEYIKYLNVKELSGENLFQLYVDISNELEKRNAKADIYKKYGGH